MHIKKWLNFKSGLNQDINLERTMQHTLSHNML